MVRFAALLALAVLAVAVVGWAAIAFRRPSPEHFAAGDLAPGVREVARARGCSALDADRLRLAPHIRNMVAERRLKDHAPTRPFDAGSKPLDGGLHYCYMDVDPQLHALDPVFWDANISDACAAFGDASSFVRDARVVNVPEMDGNVGKSRCLVGLDAAAATPTDIGRLDERLAKDAICKTVYDTRADSLDDLKKTLARFKDRLALARNNLEGARRQEAAIDSVVAGLEGTRVGLLPRLARLQDELQAISSRNAADAGTLETTTRILQENLAQAAALRTTINALERECKNDSATDAQVRASQSSALEARNRLDNEFLACRTRDISATKIQCPPRMTCANECAATVRWKVGSQTSSVGLSSVDGGAKLVDTSVIYAEDLGDNRNLVDVSVASRQRS